MLRVEYFERVKIELKNLLVNILAKKAINSFPTFYCPFYAVKTLQLLVL